MNIFTIKDNIVEIIINSKHSGIVKAIIDSKNYDLVYGYEWTLDSQGYVWTALEDYTNLYLHRLIMIPPNELFVDHINHDTLDNREMNLRVCTNQQNQMNAKISKKNTSGVKGVTWNKKSNKWRAYIKLNYKQIHLGLFNDFNLAVKTRKDAEKYLFGEFAYKY